MTTTTTSSAPWGRGSFALLVLAGSLSLTAAPDEVSAQTEFLRGDANSDGVVSISDAIMIRRFLFSAARPPACMDAGDVNDDGTLNIADQITVLVQFFPNNPSEGWNQLIAAPYPAPGTDTTDDNLDCASGDIEPPAATDDLIDLGDIVAAPGQEVEIPVFLSSSVDVDAVQIVVDFDPDQFTPGNKINYDGTFYDGVRVGFSAVQTWSDEGSFTVGIVGDIGQEGLEIPAGNNRLIAKIPGKIADSVAAGTTIELSARIEPFGPFEMRSELTHRGEARFITTLPKLDGAVMQIVGDQIFFRGDSNSDGAVNLADAQFSLNYLFLSGAEPTCRDAADANDDGKLNISDPIATLVHLFDEERTLPAPYPNAGVDPTPDTLKCASVSMP